MHGSLLMSDLCAVCSQRRGSSTPYCNPQLGMEFPRHDWRARQVGAQPRECIAITITAPTGSGKSTIARLVANALQLVGLDVAVEDDDAPTDILEGVALAHRIQALRDRGVGVSIVTHQQKRGG